MQLPPQRYRYHLNILRRARDILESSHVYILNPRDIHCSNLLYADEAWEADFNLYLLSLKYYRDKRKLPQTIARPFAEGQPPMTRRRR